MTQGAKARINMNINTQIVSKQEKYHLRCITEYGFGVKHRRSYYLLECATKTIEDNDTIWSFPPIPVYLGDPGES
jgi:hypothetical protein